MVTYLLGPLGSKIANSVAVYINNTTEYHGAGYIYPVRVYTDGKVTVSKPSTPSGCFDRIDVYFTSCTREEFLSGSVMRTIFRITIPLIILTEKPRKYFVYRAKFTAESGQPLYESEDGCNPLSAGYFGITKRNPFTRFKEHLRDATKGQGHLLHKTWNSLLSRRGDDMVVSFAIVDHCKTLEEAYAREEELVGELTLAPKGLNAIPGGMAGIRMMHQLRLLSSVNQVTPSDRDAALVRLENQPHDRNSPCAHYRTGHFRNLPSGKMTWVSPCWVNPAVV